MPGNILQVTSYTRRMNDGITQPFLCGCDDGNAYIVKGRPKLRQAELAAEWISASLAEAIGLQIPQHHLVEVGADLIEFMPDLRGQLDPGLAFATAYVDGASTLNLQQARSSISIPDQKKIYFFDRWILNTDRSLTEYGGNVNIIFDTLNNRHYLIDHNLAFDQSVTEAEYDVHVYSPSRRPWTYDLVDYQELQDLSTAAYDTLDSIIDEIPRSWISENELESNAFFDRIRSSLAKINEREFWSSMI